MKNRDFIPVFTTITINGLITGVTAQIYPEILPTNAQDDGRDEIIKIIEIRGIRKYSESEFSNEEIELINQAVREAAQKQTA